MSDKIIRFSKNLLNEFWIIRPLCRPQEKEILKSLELKLWHDGFLSGGDADAWEEIAWYHNVTEYREYIERDRSWLRAVVR